MGGVNGSKMEPTEDDYLRLADLSDPELLADPYLLNPPPHPMPPDKPKRKKGKGRGKRYSLPLIPEEPEEVIGITSFMFPSSDDDEMGRAWENVSLAELMQPAEEEEEEGEVKKSVSSDIELVWRSMSSDVFSFYKELYPIPEDLEEEAEAVYNATEDIVIQKDLPVSNDVYFDVDEDKGVFIPTTSGIENNIYLDLSWYIHSSVDDLIRAILEADEKEVPDLVTCLLELPIKSCAWAENFFISKVYHNFVKAGTKCTRQRKAGFWCVINRLQKKNHNARKLIRELTTKLGSTNY